MQLLSKQTLSVRAITREETHAGEARPCAASSGVCPSTDSAVCARNNPLSPYLHNRKKSRKKQRFAGDCQLTAGLRAER